MVKGVSKQKLTRSGNLGEKKIKDVLRGLPRNCVVINDVIMKTKTGTTQIDLIIVSVYGIFVIETKNHTGVIFGSDNSKYWTQVLYNGAHKLFFNPVVQNFGHIRQLSRLLNIGAGYFCNLIVFSNDSVNISNIQSMYAVNVNMLVNYLNMPRKEILSTYDVQEVAKNIKKLNVNSAYFKQKHKKYVQALQIKNQ